MKYATRKFDKAFEKLRKSGLTWYPWVGKDYGSNSLMIIGESNYADREYPNDSPAVAKLRIKEDVDFERKVVDCLGCCGRQKNKTMTSLMRLLSNCSESAAQLWRRVAMMEIVQEPMKGKGWCEPDCNSERGRPDCEAFKSGVEVVLEVIRLLKPTRVLFVGRGTFESFQRYGACTRIIPGRERGSGRFEVGELKFKYLVISHPAARNFRMNECQRAVQRMVLG